MGSTKTTSTLIFYVNGKKVEEYDADPEMTLLTYLRTKLRITGTKLGCGEGGCGACTVMISEYDRNHSKIRHYTANACLAPVCAMHGLAVTTVEGIGSTRTRLHPVQERIAKSHGSQCGFCTPGIVMSMYTLLRNNPQPNQLDMERAFEAITLLKGCQVEVADSSDTPLPTLQKHDKPDDGIWNLCRCTGYRPILDGFKTFTKEFQCGMGENCCRNKKNGSSGYNDEADESIEDAKDLIEAHQYKPYDASQEPIFPSKLQLTRVYDEESLRFVGYRTSWYRPTSLRELLEIKKQYPDARLINGNTEVGVEMKFKNLHYPVLVAATHVKELKEITETENGILFGGSVSLSTLEHALKKQINKHPEYKTRVFAAIVEMLRWFAGHQIRNVAAIAGNIMTASPISDLNPLFLSAACTLQVSSAERGIREVVMDDAFFPSYRKTALHSDELLVSITIPFTQLDEFFFGYKQSPRREDDIAIVNGGFRVKFEPESDVIREMSMSFGGMAPTTTMASNTAALMIGRCWDESLVSDVCESLGKELELKAGTPGGMESYRNTLTTSFFFKFYLTVSQQLHHNLPDRDSICAKDAGATECYERSATRSVQYYEEVPASQDEDDACGRPLMHQSAVRQATGEAIYTDDMPSYKDELFLGLVMSSKAHAHILDIDTSAALSMPGVHTYISAKDVPGNNITGDENDEKIFTEDEVLTEGQVIGAIVAETQVQAQKAAKAVKIKYEELAPIITIEQAIEAGSFHKEPEIIHVGDITAGFSEADHVIVDEVRLGGQEHFYLETQSTVAVPHEAGEMEVFAAAQDPTGVQMKAAAALGVSSNRVKCRVKRVGGGFGGKETRHVTPMLHCVVAAYKLQRPVRCMLERDEDMITSGTRHPYLGRYKVGFTKEGKITALELHLYSNGGYSLDHSRAVLERAVLTFDASYKIPNIYCEARTCKTNLPTNTAFRGFGSPQSMFITETWIDHIACFLSTSPDKIRQLNMYREGDLTHFGDKLVECQLQRCWDDIVKKSDYHNRKKAVQKFNRCQRWRKRGLYLIPTKYGISFTPAFLNQAGALVHIYMDGEVLLTHGGVEIGQGLHTKMIQVASRALGVPADKIYVDETSTQLVPNTSPTAASTGSDLNGGAVLNACEKLRRRLAPFVKRNPTGTWEQWVEEAYTNTVSLSATGYYHTKEIGFDWETFQGRPYNYYSYGAACSEVEIDCLTGNHTVLRTDIVMDVGRSLNPAIDIGQIEGGFVQGSGLYTLEEHRYSPRGNLLTRGPGFYKIPGFGDVPVEFNVSILKGGSTQQKVVYSSKAIGEPPLFLASSIFFALKDAIRAARAETRQPEVEEDEFFRLDSPATSERIRMACQDQFTKQFPQAPAGTYKPWSVQL